MTVLVIAPMRDECDALLRAWTNSGVETRKLTCGRLDVISVPDLDLMLSCGGTGKAQFAVHTQHLLGSRQDWEAVICAGGAGALIDDLSIGDVVVGTATIEHDRRDRFSNSPMPRFRADERLITRLSSVSVGAPAFKVHFGLVSSGDEDIVDARRRADLRRSTGALAAAWEGAGGARACIFSGVPFAEIRGITDGANTHAASDFWANLNLAMQNVATFVKYLESKRVEFLTDGTTTVG